MEKILIVEDDIGISSFVNLELQHEGYETEIANDGRTALEIFSQHSYDLILLDIMLPGLNGIEVLRRIRKVSDIPIILLTAKSDTMDKVQGLDGGADDYVTKPFEIEELLARIRRLMKRKNLQHTNPSVIPDTITCGNITLNPKSCVVTVDSQELQLTRTEYLLLLCLMSHKNEAMSREKIIDEVWGEDHYIDPNSVDVYIRYLRSKIDKPDTPSVITTLRGIGYIIKA